MNDREVRSMPEENEYRGLGVRNLKQVPWVTLLLILANVGVFLYVESTGSSENSDYMLQMGASYEPLIVEGHEYYRLITHFFLHFGWNHLVNNMVSLLVLGYATELVLGRVRFISLYVLAGIGAGAASVWYHMMSGDASVSCGASGAIFGLSGALLVLVIRGNLIRRKNEGGRGGTEVIRYLIYMGLSLYSGFTDPSIDHMAHLGGFVIGVILCFLMTVGKKKMGVSYGGRS